MNTFFLAELIQFFLGLSIIIISFAFILKHREALLDSVFGAEVKIRKSFETLTSVGYFFLFMPILLFGVNLKPPFNYDITDHFQRIIYFEAGLLFVIGILHFGVMTIFSTRIKFEKL